MPSPNETLKLCKGLLKPSGMIYIEVPNDFNGLQAELVKKGTDQWWVSVPDHVNYFTFGSLEKLLASLGFETALSTTGFPMEMFLLMGDNYLGNDELGSVCHQKRMNFELGISDEISR